MRCSEVKPGSYDCVYNIMPPYKCGMLDKIYRYIFFPVPTKTSTA